MPTPSEANRTGICPHHLRASVVTVYITASPSISTVTVTESSEYRTGGYSEPSSYSEPPSYS